MWLIRSEEVARQQLDTDGRTMRGNIHADWFDHGNCDGMGRGGTGQGGTMGTRRTASSQSPTEWPPTTLDWSSSVLPSAPLPHYSWNRKLSPHNHPRHMCDLGVSCPAPPAADWMCVAAVAPQSLQLRDGWSSQSRTLAKFRRQTRSDEKRWRRMSSWIWIISIITHSEEFWFGSNKCFQLSCVWPRMTFGSEN